MTVVFALSKIQEINGTGKMRVDCLSNDVGMKKRSHRNDVIMALDVLTSQRVWRHWSVFLVCLPNGTTEGAIENATIK